MRKLALAIVVSMAGLVPAASAAAQVPAGDAVTGFGADAAQCGGTICFRFVDTFDAHSGPSGELPTVGLIGLPGLAGAATRSLAVSTRL